MAKCLVTGHKGYIGSHVFKKLEEMGHQVVGWDLKEPTLRGNFWGCDVRLMTNFVEWGKEQKFDYIFHLAAMPRVEFSVEKPTDTFSHNVYGTQAVLEFAHKTGVKRVIFSSSSAIYGDGKGPTSPYGLQKLQSEMLCKYYSDFYGLDTVSLRYFNVYSEDQPTDGAYSTVIAAWMERLRQQKNLLINGDGEHRRDFIHVDDIVNVNIKAMENKKDFEGMAIDIGTGKNYSLNMIKTYITCMHKDAKFVYGPERAGDAKVTLADTTHQDSLGWKAQVEFEEGLDRCFIKCKH